MKWLLGACLCSSLALHGVGKTNEPPPFDADLFNRCEQVFSMHGEFLFWRVQEAALDYAVQMRHAAEGPPYYAQGNVKKATFDGDPGFRIAASYFRAPRYWEVKGQYTRMTSNGDSNTGKPEATTQYVTGTWPQLTSNPLTGANSHIHMNYNVFDLTIDRYFNPNPHLRLRVIAGLTGTWINQDWKVRYHDGTGASTTIRNRWNFGGGGLRLGAMFDWYWGMDIYMTGLTTMATYIGAYGNTAQQKNGFSLSDPETTVLDTHFHDCRPTYNVQAYFGPSYQKNLGHNRIEFFLGYEINTWFNLQEVYQSTSGAAADGKQVWINTGMIALQGLTTRLTYDF